MSRPQISLDFETRSACDLLNESDPASAALSTSARPPAIALRDTAVTLSAGNNANSNVAGRRREDDENLVQVGYKVRRLTPRECERLQGLPDDYTLVPLPIKGRQTRVRYMSDTARYRMLGNSFAVPVIRWIGERIQRFDSSDVNSALEV